jgi:4'-phosphopantetheinyl transferase
VTVAPQAEGKPSGHVSADVDVWRVPLQSSANLEWLAQLMADDERARADRFVVAAARARFIRARAALRLSLGAWLGVDPVALVFDTRCRYCGSDHGKPFLVAEGAPQFSLAYVNDLALVAVTAVAPIGIDVERVERFGDATHLMNAVLAPEEREELLAEEPSLQMRQTLLAWTRKEAVTKATGLGLAIDPRSFRVTVSSTVDPRVVRSPYDHPDLDQWKLATVDAGPSHVATLAVAAERPTVRVRDLDLVAAVSGSMKSTLSHRLEHHDACSDADIEAARGSGIAT